MSANQSNNPTSREREDLEKTVACVRQITRDFDDLTTWRQIQKGELAVLSEELRGMGGNKPLLLPPPPSMNGVFEEVERSMARRKALREELCQAVSTFAQALIRWEEDLEKRESRRGRKDTGLATTVAAGSAVEAPTRSGPSLESPSEASEPEIAPQEIKPDVPNLGPATVLAAGAYAATVTSLAWALDTSIVAGTREANIVNYGNPYGPSKYKSVASYTGDDSKSSSDVPQPQAQPVLPPPPNLPPGLAPAGFPGDEPQNHHWFPQQFEDWFSDSPRNINIDDYATEMPRQWHTGADISIHSNGYNAAWKAFIEAYPDASFSDTVNFMNALKNSMGFGQGF